MTEIILCSTSTYSLTRVRLDWVSILYDVIQAGLDPLDKPLGQPSDVFVVVLKIHTHTHTHTHEYTHHIHTKLKSLAKTHFYTHWPLVLNKAILEKCTENGRSAWPPVIFGSVHNTYVLAFPWQPLHRQSPHPPPVGREACHCAYL